MRKSCGSGLPTVRRRAGGGLDGRDDRAGARPRAVGHREGRVAARRTRARRRAGRPAPRRAARRSRSSSWPATTTTSAATARSEPLRIRRPASLDVAVDRRRADRRTRSRGRVSASTYCSAPPTVTTSSREAWKPRRQSLRTTSSSPWRPSLVTKASPCRPRAARRPPRRRAAWARRRPRRSRRGRAARRRSGARRGDGHGRARIILAAVRWTLLALCRAAAARRLRRRRQAATSTATATPPRAASRARASKVAAPAPKGEQHLAGPTTMLAPGKRYAS